MSANLRSDGKAVDVVLERDAVKGDLVWAEKFYGVAMNNGSTGDTIAIETTQREFVFKIDAAITAPKGAVLMIDSADGVLKDENGTYTGDQIRVLKVTKAKDGNNVIWAKLLPQNS